MSNKRNTVIYTGVTNNLCRRVFEHKNKLNGEHSFTAKYNVDKLVYYEVWEDICLAIAREKQIKGGSRKNKIKLIEKDNPKWNDLYDEINDCGELP